MIPLATVIWLLGIIHNSRQFFLESPSNLSTIAGESITFRCAAEKSPEPIVYSQWKSNTGSLLGYHQEGVLPGHQGRFSYVKQNAEELHLKITHVNLDDDGEYECQMLHPEAGPIRAKAFLNILVPPQLVYFSNYQPNSVIAVKENTPLNITCVVPNVKPEPQVLWYMDGKVMSRDVKQASMPHLNKTFTVYTSLVIQPGRSDHGKIVTCEVVQKETDTRITTNTTLDVLFPPSEPTVEILGNPSVLRAGDNVTVACAVTGGNPPPDVFWYHENKRLQSHSTLDTRTKEIRNVYSFIATQNDNMAEYECRANNSHSGNAKRKALKFEVNYPPASVELFGESNIRQGSSAMIQCKSLPSNPASQITWVINGRTVPTPTQREFFMENGIVSSSNISVHSNELSQDAHQINVECIATNPEGSSAKQHLIKIIAPPKAPRITGLEDRKFFEGDIVNVTCEAQGGNPLAELSWYRGSEKVNGAHNEVAGFSSFSTLALRVDRTMNTQRLKCEATNAALDEPLIESQYLSVYYPPRRVLIRPAESSDQRLLINKPARLVCGTLSSNPAAQITWQFSRANDDKVHSGDVSLNETTRDNGYNVENVLSFVPTEEYDGTVVHCIANHPEWKHSVNTSFPLNVMYPPKMLVNDPVTVIMSEGDSFKENLTVRGNPAVSLWQWRKNGVPFDHTIGRVFARGAVLSGKQLLSTDAGVYTLTATNSVGSTNITIKLAVEYSARITSISTPVIAATGDTVLLECEAEGEPSKSNMINWYKNGEPLPTQYRGNKKAILRLNATEQQSGEYICRADNGIGVPAEGKTFLLVNSAPRVLPVARYSKTAGILGGVAKARCKVYAVPTVEFVWEKDEQLIKKNSSKYSIVNTQIDYSTYESTLWIKNIVPDDYTKTVKCIARNSFGTDYLSIPIIPPTNPEEPFNLTMTNSTLNTISVAWEPRFDGGSDQIFEIKYKKQNDDLIHLVNTTHTNLRLSGLAIANTYYFQIRAINARGFASGWTSPVIFATLNEDGVNIAMVQNRELEYIKYFPLLLLVAIICILLAILVACCLLCSRNKKRKLREKTEMARTAINGGDVRQVQMYGTMMGHDGMTRHDIDDRPDISEDEHSVRTMIEVSPNGYMQPIEPMLYESTGLLEYDYQSGRSYMGSSQGTTGRNITYANVPYPEPPQPSYHHHSNWNSLQRQSNNNTSPQHHLSTFINPMGVRAGPINYAQLDGDLV